MQKGNLLIVDDEPLLLTSMTFALKSITDNIYTSLNGKEALLKLAENEIHCIICDINMPEMNGVELIQKIRENNSEIPFIFYTGHGSHELMLEAVKYGAFDFLNKPHMDGIEEIVKRGLNKGLGLQEEATDSEFISEYKRLLAIKQL